jgi:hypothetical protein
MRNVGSSPIGSAWGSMNNVTERSSARAPENCRADGQAACGVAPSGMAGRASTANTPWNTSAGVPPWVARTDTPRQCCRFFRLQAGPSIARPRSRCAADSATARRPDPGAAMRFRHLRLPAAANLPDEPLGRLTVGMQAQPTHGSSTSKAHAPPVARLANWRVHVGTHQNRPATRVDVDLRLGVADLTGRWQ